MQDNDIPKQPIFATDDEGLDHNGTVHAYECECQQCAMYWSITTTALDAMMEPLADCEGDDCQGCRKCPEVRLSEIFTGGEPQSAYITLEELQALDPNPQLQDTTPYTGPYLVIPPTQLP